MAKQRDKVFPSRDAIVAFIRAHPGKVGTREIAREFGLKNADRVELKRILHDLADDGTIAKRRRKMHEPAVLPPTVIADIAGRDVDGELLATPTEWDEAENGATPKIRIHVPRRPQAGTMAGVGDRALVRIEKIEEDDGTPYRGHIIKVIDRTRTRLLGIFRKLPDGGGRLIPVDKKQTGRELNIAKADSNGAEDGDLVSVDLIRTRAFGLASGRVKERLGSIASEKAISLIAIHAHEIRKFSRRPRYAKPRRQHPQRCPAAKTGANCHSSPSIRLMPRTTTTRFTPSRIPIRTTRAAISSMSRSPTSPSMCDRSWRSTAMR